MNKLILCVLILVSSHALSDPIVNEAVVLKLSKEFHAAYQNLDMSMYDKYIDESAELITDKDPKSSGGLHQVTYKKFMSDTEMGIRFLDKVEVSEEVVSIVIDQEKNTGTIEELVTSKMYMLGVKVHCVVKSITTYGVIDGDIKVVRSFGET